jgi:hypothetical protein
MYVLKRIVEFEYIFKKIHLTADIEVYNEQKPTSMLKPRGEPLNKFENFSRKLVHSCSARRADQEYIFVFPLRSIFSFTMMKLAVF